MEEQYQRKRFHNAHEWRRFFFLWVTVFLWLFFLGYMVGLHFYRESFQPIVMAHVGVTEQSFYFYAEMKLFLYFIWACTTVSILAIINTWNKKRRKGDNIPDVYLVVIMAITVFFAFYYAKVDLQFLQLSFLGFL